MADEYKINVGCLTGKVMILHQVSRLLTAFRLRALQLKGPLDLLEKQPYSGTEIIQQ